MSAAHNEWNHVGIALVAMEEGFFAREGLTDVELISFDEGSKELLDREAAQVDLLAEGMVDIAIDPRTTFVLEARAEKRPVCIVAARRKNHAFALVGEKGLKTLEDLRGRVIEMGHRGGATDVMMRQVLKDHGLEPDKDVPFAYKGGAMHDPKGVIHAFMEGRYGPAVLVSVAEIPTLTDRGYPILADLRKLYPSRHDRITAANELFVTESPDLLKGFLKGMIQGCRYVLDLRNRQRFKQIILEAGFLTSEREQRSFDNLFDDWQERVSHDLTLPMDGIRLVAEEQKRAGKLSSAFKVEDALKLEALRQAQQELESVSKTAERD